MSGLFIKLVFSPYKVMMCSNAKITSILNFHLRPLSCYYLNLYNRF